VFYIIFFFLYGLAVTDLGRQGKPRFESHCGIS